MLVIPAQAGPLLARWIPACAGMTGVPKLSLISPLPLLDSMGDGLPGRDQELDVGEAAARAVGKDITLRLSKGRIQLKS